MFRNTLFQQISQSKFRYIFDRSLPNAILIVQLNRGKPLGSNIVKQNMQIKNIQFLKKRYTVKYKETDRKNTQLQGCAESDETIACGLSFFTLRPKSSQSPQPCWHVECTSDLVKTASR